MKKKELFEGEGGISELRVNENYAKRFEYNKKRQDLERLKELAADYGVNSDDEDSEEEDEEGDMSPETEAKIFETLAKIKKKDPLIYKADVTFFDEKDEKDEKKSSSKEHKKVYLKDLALENAKAAEESSDEDSKRHVKTYSEEQEEIRREFLNAAFENKEEVDDLLTVRPKKHEESQEIENVVEEAAKEYFGKEEELDEKEKFLKNYLLNQGWIDTNDDFEPPHYNEIVGEIEEDEEAVDKQEEFEAKYNFRFEEGVSSQVEGHGRKVEGSVRKKSEKRKAARKSRAEKKLEEETSRNEEIKRLKSVKRKELEEKLTKVKEVAGEIEGFEKEDLEGDFDPEEYDNMMQKIFGESYYEGEDEDLEAEMEEKLEEEVEVGEGLDEDVEGLEEGKKGFKQVREKVVGEEEKVELEKLLEEYYKLDYEDVVGGLATRFKYRDVKPNRYGLSAEEIFEKEDKDLNQIVSVKKLAPYRGDEWEVKWPKSKPWEQNENKDEGKIKKRKANFVSQEKPQQSKEVPTVLLSTSGNLPKSAKKNLKKKLKRMEKRGEDVETIPVSRLKSYGVDSTGKKLKKKKKTES